MQVTKVIVLRSYSLGNYECLKVSFEAELNEQDKPLEVSRDLELLCNQHHENSLAAAKQQTPVKQQLPAQIANQNQAKKEHILTGLPKEQADFLEAKREGTNWIIHTTGYLKPDAFKAVNEYIKAKGGKYVPATPTTHPYWEAPQ